MNITVLGSGAFGIAISISLFNNGNNVSLWSYKTETNEIMKKTRQNEKVLKDVFIPEGVNLTDDISVTKDSDIIIIATPSYAVKDAVLKIKEHINENTIIVLLAKGIIFEDSEYLVFTQLVKKILGQNQPTVSLTGPTHAEEIAKNKPSAIVSASDNEYASKMVQKAFMSEIFRVYTGDDILGAQLGGAFKNVIAIAAGMSDGMGFGDNATAALITRGFAEISRLGVAMGAKKETFSGLSGIGDLIVTCMSKHSRNRKAGEFIGKGLSAKDACDKVGTVVEGFYATKYGYELSKLMNIEMPIVCGVYDILYNDMNPKEAFSKIMNRIGKSEVEPN